MLCGVDLRVNIGDFVIVQNEANNITMWLV